MGTCRDVITCDAESDCSAVAADDAIATVIDNPGAFMKPFRNLLIAAIAGLALHTMPVHADTATNLKCKGCVGKKDIGKDAVTGAKVKNGSIGPNDLAAAAKPGGANDADGEQILQLVSSFSVVRSVAIAAPTDGLALVVASGSIGVGSSTIVRCGIALGTSVDTDHEITAGSDLTATVIMPVAAVRLFDVAAGDTTINFLCREMTGQGSVLDSVLTATFLPNRY